MAGKVIVHLAMHWPCVTDISGSSTYGLKAQKQGDEYPTYTPHGVWHSYLLTFLQNYSSQSPGWVWYSKQNLHGQLEQVSVG